MAGGVATTGPAEVTTTGGTLARVGQGECLISPALRLWCRLPWQEAETDVGYAWLFGTLSTEQELPDNRVFVGLPPLIDLTGSWQLRRQPP